MAPGAAKMRFTFMRLVRLDDDARVQFARDDLIDVEPIGIMLEIQALNVQAVPVDEILMQRVVDRVQTGDAQISAELQRGLLRAVAYLGIAAQPPASNVIEVYCAM